MNTISLFTSSHRLVESDFSTNHFHKPKICSCYLSFKTQKWPREKNDLQNAPVWKLLCDKDHSCAGGQKIIWLSKYQGKMRKKGNLGLFDNCTVYTVHCTVFSVCSITSRFALSSLLFFRTKNLPIEKFDKTWRLISDRDRLGPKKSD